MATYLVVSPPSSIMSNFINVIFGVSLLLLHKSYLILHLDFSSACLGIKQGLVPQYRPMEYHSRNFHGTLLCMAAIGES